MNATDATAASGFDPDKPWLKILSAYRKPHVGRSTYELVVTVLAFALLWAAAWASIHFGYWLGLITSYDRRGWDVRDALREEERVSALQPSVLQEAARRYLDTSNYVHAWLVPQAQPAP